MKRRSPRSASPSGSPTKADLFARIAALEKQLRAATRALARKDGEGRALARELGETREQQTATNEILRVISSSPTDTQPVFEAIARNAARLCGSTRGSVVLLGGDRLHFVAWHNFPATTERDIPVSDAPHATRVIREGLVFHISDIENDSRVTPESLRRLRLLETRAYLNVPMKRDDVPIGSIAVYRNEPGSFSDKHVELLQTFADQAVIAIENVRLFTELRARNRDLTEALEQQTATSEILRVISSSPTDLQPVFDTIAASATRLCDALYSLVFRFDGETITLVADDGSSPERLAVIRSAYPAPPGRTSVAAQAILERRVIAIADAQSDTEYPQFAERSEAIGCRGIVSVPMLRGDTAIGAINVARVEAIPFTETQIELLKTFADQAVIAIENVRLFTELEARNAELTEILAGQMATAEVLRAISRAQTDVQPVFDIIATSARRLCGASYGQVQLYDGELIHLAALDNVDPAGAEAIRRAYPLPMAESNLGGRVIGRRAVVQIADLLEDRAYQYKSTWEASGLRSLLGVPMLKDGEPIGAIAVGRPEPGSFPDKQVELLRTFADQAVIAIENVRLFKELQARNTDLREALDTQTATSDILRVISRSQTDVQPVFDAIVCSAVRLCDGLFGAAFRFDGELLHLAAHHNYTPEAYEALQRMVPMRPRLDSPLTAARAILTRDVAEVTDALVDHPEYADYAQAQQVARAGGFRGVLAVPMLREASPVGAIFVARAQPGPFPTAQVELLKTFADQAVIAIENVRLFKELQSSNTELQVALEQQTATSELLKVIGRSTFDLQPVFDTLVENAVRLCGAERAFIYRFDGQLLRVVASHNASPEMRAFVAQNPLAPGRHSGSARAALERRTIHIHDVQADPEYTFTAYQVDAYRTVLAIPMLRTDELLGVILIYRLQVQPFNDSQIALMETFADQAVIAIENARLLTELHARTAELTRSVGELTALGEVSRALSSTLDLETVLQTIVMRANEIAGTAGCTIWEYDQAREEFRLRASDYPDEEEAATLQGVDRVTTIRKGVGVTTQVMERREPVQVHDIAVEGAEENPIRRRLIEAGHHALLGVPLLSEDEVIGVLAVTRKTPGEFEPEIVRLLSAFATQSALAIQNARLFLEIEDKGRQLEAASQHKSEFLANMSHELRTPLNAIIGFSEVLAEGMFGEINDKQGEYLRDILESGRHLLSLINDILDLSKIEAGRMELELEDFDVPGAVDNALTLVRERAGRRGIALGRAIDGRVGAIRADERKVKQVLLNLLSNAIKFTPEGGRVDVRAAVKDTTLEVSVADTGVGIAPEDREAVFEEFRQVGTAAKKVEGTGLGLALSRKFIELHGGRIWVKSEVGIGSTFTFTLPLSR